MTDKEMLNRARDAWDGMAKFRMRRRRAVDFTFGRQWGDSVRLPDGRWISEERMLAESGRIPIANNLIRQLVKSVTGRWRWLQREEKGDNDALDARCFEEFLISGCAVQRLDLGSPYESAPQMVNPSRFFAERFERADGSDCAFMGMLHDMQPADCLSLFGSGDNSRRAAVISACRHSRDLCDAPPLEGWHTEFDHTGTSGAWRVIEVWSKGAVPVLRCHDPEKGLWNDAEVSERVQQAIERLNTARRRKGRKEVSWCIDIDARWTQTFMTPRGEILERRRHKPGVKPPFALLFYPMVDGEAHSLVDDLIEQQKYVNRLVMMLDDVMRASAKGVVMFPVDQLPEGLSWKDVRRIWSEPGGILPFKRTSSNIMPYQLQSSGTSQGAADMLATQLRMFDEISGSSSGTRGTESHATGAEMFRQEVEQATVAVYDLLAAFADFTKRRDNLLENQR